MAKQIPLTRGKFAIVDDEDYEEMSRYKWTYTGAGYAMRFTSANGKRVAVFMHRAIANTPKGMDTDHINGNRIDNQRTNLRVCTRSQNIMNARKHKDAKGKYKGVNHNWIVGVWTATIVVNYKKIYLGSFRSERDAALAYNEAARKYHGEFANLNMIE